MTKGAPFFGGIACLGAGQRGPLSVAGHLRHGAVHWAMMALVVHLPEELARRVEELAAERGVDPEQLVVEAVEAQLPARRRLSFIGMGHSGRGDMSERVKELRREVADEHRATEG